MKKPFKNFLTVVTFEGSSNIIAVEPTRKRAEKVKEKYINPDTFGIPKSWVSVDIHENDNPDITAPYYDIGG